MVAGLFTMGIGALLFLPAASVPSFPFFLTALIVLAAGMTILQVSANPYVAILGPEKTAASRLNLAQAFNSLGTTIGPKLGGFLILSSAPLAVAVMHAMSAPELQTYRVQQASSVKMPYLVFALALMALGVAIALFKLPSISSVEKHSGGSGDSIWRHTHLVLGAIGIFVYVGAEVSIGSFLVNYFSQPDIGNISERVAAGFVSFYWAGAMIGRFIGSALLNGVKTAQMIVCSAITAVVAFAPGLFSVPIQLDSWPRFSGFLTNVVETIQQGRPLFVLCLITLILLAVLAMLNGGRIGMKDGHLLGLAGTLASVLVVASMMSSGHFAMWSMLLVGFFNSIMFPSIFTLAIEGLGPLTGDGSGLLVAAIVGGAIIPEVQGIIADRIGIHHAFFLPILCYIYIAYFAFVGSQKKQPVVAAA
jgi:FHS family L-fucose permease-like MFS transporter